MSDLSVTIPQRSHPVLVQEDVDSSSASIRPSLIRQKLQIIENILHQNQIPNVAVHLAREPEPTACSIVLSPGGEFPVLDPKVASGAQPLRLYVDVATLDALLVSNALLPQLIMDVLGIDRLVMTFADEQTGLAAVRVVEQLRPLGFRSPRAVQGGILADCRAGHAIALGFVRPVLSD